MISLEHCGSQGVGGGSDIKRREHAYLVMYDSLQPLGLQPHQPPLSMEFSRQEYWKEYWSGLPFPSVGDLPNPEIKPSSLASPKFGGRFFTTEPL